jgi:hypothetical protein
MEHCILGLPQQGQVAGPSEMHPELDARLGRAVATASPLHQHFRIVVPPMEEGIQMRLIEALLERVQRTRLLVRMATTNLTNGPSGFALASCTLAATLPPAAS